MASPARNARAMLGFCMASVVAVARELVVDDNAENRALAQATLEDEDIPSSVASSGPEALALIAAESFACILLDIRMPGMDGVEVCTRVRARPDGARIAILFLTAERDVATFDRALAAGGDDFVTKPFRPCERVARIYTAIRLRELTAVADSSVLERKQQRDVLHRVQLEKDQLTQFLVHDFKNPVNAIQLQAQRVLRSASDPRALDAAERDRDLVHRVLANLVDNAIRHAPEHSRVTIAARPSAAGIELRVTDQGEGVPEELRPHVFDRYVSQCTSLTSGGLGLAFCRVAVEAHGGRIWIEDAEPGAVFAIELPTAVG